MASVFYPVQRGFDNVIANWPLLLIRVAETVLVLIVTVAGVFLTLILTGLMAAISAVGESFDNPERVAEWIVENPHLLAVMFGLALVVGLIGIVIHSFVIGGVIGCLVDAEKMAPQDGPRSSMKAFSPERWLAWCRQTWWPVFLIYNVTWGVYGLVLLVPCIFLLALMFAVDGAGATIVAGCIGLAIIVVIALIGGIIVMAWSRAALAISIEGDRDVMGPVRDGFRVCLDRFGEVAVLYVVMTGIAFGVGGAVVSFNFGMELVSPRGSMVPIALVVQIVLSLIQSAVSVVTSTWTVASTVSIVHRWAGRDV